MFEKINGKQQKLYRMFQSTNISHTLNNHPGTKFKDQTQQKTPHSIVIRKALRIFSHQWLYLGCGYVAAIFQAIITDAFN